MKLKPYLLLGLAAVVGILIGLASLKAVWMNGFDTGVDVDQCVIAYFQQGKDESVLQNDESCKRAHAAKDGLMWAAFARKGK